MPFRETFDCLWCGRPHTARSPADIEGYAQLCPDCVGKAGDNGFLRFRVRAALQERAAEQNRGGDMVEYYRERAAEYDDWYLRRGRYSRGPVHDLAWQMDLDTATSWLDALPIQGEIVELAAGTGWWSPLLAQKGELSLYDAVEQTLDRARERLLAHGLRAHLHVRDAWAEPDRQVDAVFTGFWLSHVRRADLAAFLRLVRRWLKPGGMFAFIDSRRDPQSGAVDETAPEHDLAVRHLADGRTFTIPKVFYGTEELENALRLAGFTGPSVTTTSRFFLMGRASAGTDPEE